MFYLVTPAKDEAQNLRKTIESVAASRAKPTLWVIVDDDSADETPNILTAAVKAYPWIRAVKSNRGGGYDWLAYAEVVRIGVAALNPQLSVPSSSSTYLGILDADIHVDEDYFARLLALFDEDPQLAVVSGDICIQEGDTWTVEGTDSGRPRGGARVQRWASLVDIGGYPLTPSPDTVTDFLVTQLGWRVYRLSGAYSYQVRPTRDRSSRRVSALAYGRGRYMLRMRYGTAVATAVSTCWQEGLRSGSWFLLGYLSAALRQEPRIEDRRLDGLFKSPAGWLRSKVSQRATSSSRWSERT